uniref:Zf-LSD1 domain-containing protein n=1 Tax=Angiostrongylus cantonensis TaxID=6313 RepID=A0A0K0CXH8_ANGCA
MFVILSEELYNRIQGLASSLFQVADARAGANRNDNFLNMIPPEPVPIRANNRVGGEIWMHIAHMAHPPIPGLGGFAHPQYLVRNIVPHDEQPFIHRRMNLMGGGDHIIKCPECRQPTRVPPEGLPVNFRLQEVLDRMADSNAASNSLDSREAASTEADTDGHPRCLVCNDVMHKGIYLVCLTCVGENVSTQTVMEAFGTVADSIQFELLSRTEQLDSKLPGVIKNVTDEFHNRIVTVMDEFIRNALGQDDIRRDLNLKPDILRKRPYVTRARAKQEGYNSNHSDLEADRQRREMGNRGNEGVNFITETPVAVNENIGDESIEILSETSSAADENKKDESINGRNMQKRSRGLGATVERCAGNRAVENGGYPSVAESSSHRERVMKRKYGAIDPGPSSFSATHGNDNMDDESAEHIPNDTGESGSD